MKKGQKDNYMSENVLTIDNAEYITDLLSKEVERWTKAAAALIVLLRDVWILAYIAHQGDSTISLIYLVTFWKHSFSTANHRCLNRQRCLNKALEKTMNQANTIKVATAITEMSPKVSTETATQCL